MTKTFSIIIPVYNVEKYLSACLESVFSQSYLNYEVICVNDGSLDGSLAILQQYADFHPEMKIINQENRGLSAARNAGLREAGGEYVLFLDSDDWLEKNALQVLVDNVEGEDMVCFSGRRYFEKTKTYEKADVLTPETNITGWEYYNRYSLSVRQVAFVCVVLRVYRRAFLAQNGLNFTEGIYHEDNMFTPQACYYALNVKVIPDCLYDYRVRDNSITTTLDLKHKKDILYIANALSAFFISKPIADKTVVYRSLTHHYQSVFKDTSYKEDKALLPFVDWNLYRMVSCTKLRHRLHYFAMRMSPKLFRLLYKCL